MRKMESCRIRWPLVLACLLFGLQCRDCYKIWLLPLFTRSHILSLTAIGDELARRGHDVHMLVINNFPLSPELTSNQSGITIIRYGPKDQSKAMNYDALYDNISRRSIESNIDMITLIFSVRELMKAESHGILVGNDQLFEEMTAFHYDLAVVDSIFFARYLYLIPHRLGVPWITYTDILNPWLIKVPWLPSFYSPQTVNFYGKMTFLQRLENVMISTLFFYYPLVPDPSEEVLSEYRKYGTFGSTDDLISRSLLFVITSDVVLDDPLPFMPNMINAGGLTVKPTKSNALPQEFETFIEAAKSGIVIISFGSMAASLPTSIALKFIDAFTRVPDLHFIWRFKNTDDLTLPKNVMTADWLPQNDLLADPRSRVFITHCGINGLFEAVYHGVPMIGFPLLGDQPHNARRIEFKGYGVSMNIRSFTSDELLENIQKILSDPSYRRRVRLASEIFRSAARSPTERVVDGVEHVLKFGADHLRSVGNDLPFYQYLMLDVLAFIALIVLAACVLLWRTTWFLIRRTFIAFRLRLKSKSD